jgi:molybdopterin/thiamine biosynthesis adenylyltransferase
MAPAGATANGIGVAPNMLTDTQIERYSRQIILPEVGGRGQQTLLSAAVAVVGAGEPANTAAVYLAAAGVGTLSVADAIAAALDGLNPDCTMRSLPLELTADNAAAVVRSSAVVIAAGASWETCDLLNALCVTHRKPFVWAHAENASGQITTFAGHQADAPCYRCLRAQPLPPHALPALDAVTAAFIGSVQATETIKILLGMATLTGRLMTYDALDVVARETPIAKNPSCAICGTQRTHDAVTG